MIKGTCHCGAVTWQLNEIPESATSCNCTLCRRYGTLWAYGFQDEVIEVSGPTKAYLRGEKTIEFHFCTNCGCMAFWRTKDAGDDGRYYMAVNLRLAEPDHVADIPIRRFDGLEWTGELPRDGACVRDLWF